jgi:hypothetical protein
LFGSWIHGRKHVVKRLLMGLVIACLFLGALSLVGCAPKPPPEEPTPPAIAPAPPPTAPTAGTEEGAKTEEGTEEGAKTEEGTEEGAKTEEGTEEGAKTEEGTEEGATEEKTEGGT